MTEYQFTLKFALPQPGSDPEEYLDALYEAGCDDALVGLGQHGAVGLDFLREAKSAMTALRSAIRDVEKAIPQARLIEVTPDLVGLTEIAEVLACTRQNVRKIVSAANFPLPAHTGGHASLWHLIDVLNWADEREQTIAAPEPRRLFEIAAAAATTNAELQYTRYKTIKPNTALKRKKAISVTNKKAAIRSKRADVA